MKFRINRQIGLIHGKLGTQPKSFWLVNQKEIPKVGDIVLVLIDNYNGKPPSNKYVYDTTVERCIVIQVILNVWGEGSCPHIRLNYYP